MSHRISILWYGIDSIKLSLGMVMTDVPVQDSDADTKKVIRMVIILNSNLRAQFLMLREFVIVLGGFRRLPRLPKLRRLKKIENL